MAVSALSPSQREKLIKSIEAQGGRTRPTKRGIMVYAPDGHTITVHTTYGDYRATKNDIAWFRRHNLIHPDDKQPKEDPMAEKNEEGYPVYMTEPIHGTTRRRVLAELEKKGWPLEVRNTELDLDSTTASRALYAVGYRWNTTNVPVRKRVWMAPDDIRELHEKAKAEMDRREAEDKERRSHLHALPGGAPTPKDIATMHAPVSAATVLQDAVEKARTEGLPSLDFAKPVGHEGEHHPVRLADVGEEVNKRMSAVADAISAPKPQREFIDNVDSWVANMDKVLGEHLSRMVRDRLEVLTAIGIEYELRMWRKP